MAVVTPQENQLRVSTNNGETISLKIDAGAPVTVHLEIENNCGCAGTTQRAGAYTDTNFGIR